MANNKTSGTKTSEAKKSAPKTEIKDEPIIESTPKKIVPKDIDPSQYATVKNGFQGKLEYISPKTGEHFVWEAFGDEQDMELRELRNAKSSAKKFFQNNWFMFEDDWVIDYLGLGQLYKNAIAIDEFDDIFNQNPEEVKKTVKAMSEGQKKSVKYRASKLISEGELDSLKVIAALEDALGVELIEK